MGPDSAPVVLGLVDKLGGGGEDDTGPSSTEAFGVLACRGSTGYDFCAVAGGVTG